MKSISLSLLSLLILLIPAQGHGAPDSIPFTRKADWLSQTKTQFLIYNPMYRKVLFVSNDKKGQDHLVEAHRHTTEKRNRFVLLPSSQGLYLIRNPEYKEHLFVSNDTKGQDHIVESHGDSGEKRNRWQLQFTEDGLYLLANPDTGRFAFVTNDTSGDDNIVEAHSIKSDDKNKFAFLAIPELTQDQTANWMKQHFSKIKSRNLRQLVLPGTHDSATYQLTDREADMDPGMKAVAKISKKLVKKWSQAQEQNIYQQLMGGIRYFDLRPRADGGKHYIHHSLCGVEFKVILEDIKKFVSDPGRSELILISISHYENFKDKDFFNLRKAIIDTLKPYIHHPPETKPGDKIPRFTFQTLETIMGATPGGSKIIFLTSDPKLNNEDESSHAKFFPIAWDKDENIFDDYSDSDSYESMKNDQIKKSRMNFRRAGKLFLLSWTLTPQIPRGPGDIKRFYDKDLHWLSRQANVSLPYYASRELVKYAAEGYGANILYVDFYRDAYVVETALMLNGLQ